MKESVPAVVVPEAGLYQQESKQPGGSLGRFRGGSFRTDLIFEDSERQRLSQQRLQLGERLWLDWDFAGRGDASERAFWQSQST